MATKEKQVKETPLMKQYNEIKRKYPDACLLFRVGDFYETFGEDAVRTAAVLGTLLTTWAVPLLTRTSYTSFFILGAVMVPLAWICITFISSKRINSI